MTTAQKRDDNPEPTSASSHSRTSGGTTEPAIAGAHDIVLVADRQAGTMYHFFRDWRFESWCAADPTAEPLVSVPIDPRAMASSGTRYEMEYVGERPAATAQGTAAFTWSVAFSGARNPLADGLERARLLLAQSEVATDTLPPTRLAGKPT